MSNAYSLSTIDVISAGRNLQMSLQAGALDISDAISELESAANVQDQAAQSYRAFMFASLENAEPAEKVQQEKIRRDLFATSLSELQVGSVLVAAGQAVGEAGGSQVKDGKASLDRVLKAVDQAGPADTSITQTNLIQSPNPTSGINTFRSVSDEAMKTFVTELRQVAASVIEALKAPLKQMDISDAIARIGAPLADLGRITARLINKGVQKIKDAVDFLTKVVGSEMLENIKGRIRELWDEIGKKKSDELIDQVLAKFIGIGATEKIINEALARALTEQALDEASDQVSQLTQSYKDKMKMARTAITTVSLVAGVLFFIPGAGHNAALVAAGAYLIVLSGALLVAQDYCDSGHGLNWVHGVGSVAGSLR